MAEDDDEKLIDLSENDINHRNASSSSKSKGSLFERVLDHIPIFVLASLIALSAVIILLQSLSLVYPQQCNSDSSTQTDTLLSNQTIQMNNYSDLLHQTYDTTQASADKLTAIIHTLSNLEISSESTKGAIDDILLVTEQLLKLQNKTAIFSSHVPVSCQDIKKFDPDSPSGYYHINSQLVYCEMMELCGSSDGWTRLGYLDMSDSTISCPEGFLLYQGQGIRGCHRPAGGASCASTRFPSNGITYTEVCGRVTGYQYGSPDGVDTRFISTAKHNDINSYYVDGVSITHGYPRVHIWTLMAGVKESYSTKGNCPCNTPPGGTQDVQSFVGDDYFCESGNPTNSIQKKVYAVDPLWDGKGCGSQELDCCSGKGLPWFHRVINSTSDYIELRECGDQQTADEDVYVSFYDIYVK